ncbi:hypothetical protein [Variovorax gossypii]
MASLSITAETSLIALSETLRALRLEQGESQALAAQRIGVSSRTYQRMEAGAAGARGAEIPAAGVAIGDFIMALEVYGVDVVAALTALRTPGAMSARKRGRTPEPHPSTLAAGVAAA